jgi:hypothetical protein
MKTLATYIEYLIMTRHYAFVPGLGGFMVKECAARVETTVDAQGVTRVELVPPRREVGFNRFMTHDDGQLVATLMEFEGLDFDDAEASIRQEVGRWKAELERRAVVALGKWGQLSADDDCHWVFTPAGDNNALMNRAHHYGLESFRMTGWQEPQPAATLPSKHEPAVREDEGHTHIVLPFNRTVLRRVAMIVLVLTVCFCGFFLPSHQQNDSSRAGMIDSEILTGQRLPNVTLRHTWEEIWDDEVARVEQEDSLTDALAHAETASPSEMEDEAATLPEDFRAGYASETSRPEADKLYYIIVGSCANTAEADRQIARLQRAGVTDVGVILKDERYRICLSAFDDRATAEEALGVVRDVELFHDAWLLPARQATVTYISKIKYNEQLPMELSHLTTGTQRDQGGDHS